MTSISRFFATPMMAPPDANGPAGFTTQWHGHGAGHQANNEPGDTAADRHNFQDAVAGKSNVNPTYNDGMGGLSSATGLPLVAFDSVSSGNDDNGDEEDMMDII